MAAERQWHLRDARLCLADSLAGSRAPESGKEWEGSLEWRWVSANRVGDLPAEVVIC